MTRSTAPLLLCLFLGALPAWAEAPSLRVKDVTVGAGDPVEPGTLVTLHFTGRLDDGTVFDTTLLRAEPVVFREGGGQVPPAWEQGVMGMRPGGHRKVDVPPALGFGDKGAGRIPPDATLHLDLFVLDVGPPRKPPEQPKVASGLWRTTGTGAKVAQLTDGRGTPAVPGDIVLAELTAWLSDGSVLDSSYSRLQADTFKPGSGNNHPDLEAAMLGSRPGDRKMLEIVLSPGQPPVRLLLEVVDVRPGRVPPEAPTPVPSDSLQETDSGLRYVDMVVGDGAEARPGDTVVVEYTGWLRSGERFDSSLSRAEPFSFRLGQREVIAGWDEGVSGMREGGTRQLVVPPELGYGDRGAPPTIPPYATLVFEVTLLAVE